MNDVRPVLVDTVPGGPFGQVVDQGPSAVRKIPARPPTWRGWLRSRQARPGDLVALGSPVDNIGIYAGGNTMVVAPRSGDVVEVQQVTRTPPAIRRVL